MTPATSPLAEALILPNLLADRASSNEVFLQHVDGGSASYAEVEQAVRGWSAALQREGIGAGSTVLTMLPNVFETVHVWMATARLGAIEVPINTAYRGSILTHVTNNSGATVAVVHADYVDRFEAVADTLRSLRTIVVVGGRGAAFGSLDVVAAADVVLDGAAPEGEPVRPQRWDVACILYTSGTTGPSKGVIISWGQVHATTTGCMPLDDLGEDDAWYSPFPMFHMSGKLALYGAALLGSRFVLRDGFSTNRFWSEVRQFGCTISLLVGTTQSFIASLPPQPDDADSPLRNVLMAPLPDDPAAFMKRFDVRITTVFNMTEISAPVWSQWDLGPKGSCGRLRAGYEVRIVDGHDEEVPAGVLGEIVVRSDDPWKLMLGYWQMPDKTVEAWRNYWFHTGDAGFRDEDGFFYFVDRQKDAIRRRGENISSMEVEAEVNAHPAVAESAVIGVPAEVGEEEVMVFAVQAEGSTLEPADLVSFLDDRLPRFMVPRYVAVVDSLPKTPTEKVRKHLLRDDHGSYDVWDRQATP
jgi:crotonobetaine/carnitine-CoA ligase